MSEVTDLTVLEIKPEQAPALYVANGLDAYLDIIREMAKEVPDVTTKKGRDRIGSLARMVGSSKKAIEEPGRAYLRHLKEAVKPAEGELRRFTTECDSIRDGILKPRDDWEAEQLRLQKEEEERIAAEAYNAMRDDATAMNIAFDSVKAEALKKQIEADHELALLMNKDIDRDRAEAARLAEQLRIENEQHIAREAEEKVKRELEEKQQREREASAARERESQLRAERAEQARKDAVAKAESDKKAALEKAEREKQEAIADAQRKAQQEADRIKRETEAKEAARLAEEKRVADEAAARAANIEHQKDINNQVMAILVKAGISPECAKECIIAIARYQNYALVSGITPPVQINY